VEGGEREAGKGKYEQEENRMGEAGSGNVTDNLINTIA
jgi:hypothetical protein